ncbi:MAG: FAD-dependent thymidylate synthase [Candidatus Paceibacterota bacterium]|jgi:hypothetical protein
METLRESPGGISVGLRGFTNVNPTELASDAATSCYQATLPKQGGKTIGVEQSLFMTGHHTTLQHWNATFAIDGLSVGDVTFGLHLTSPFYDTDQRSGRFCSEMFAQPDFAAIEKYVRTYWPEVRDNKISEIIAYIKMGLGFYAESLEGAINLSRKHVMKERPHISKKNLDSNVDKGKIAQEQMRMFIPIIFPTGLYYTINMSALFAQWTVAWSPTMRVITDMMRDLVLEQNPELSYMFNPERRRKEDDWYPKRTSEIYRGCSLKPGYILEEMLYGENVVVPNPEDMHPVDLLHFKPEYMDNSDTIIRSMIHISCATMGQDQRHRTIRRSEPFFTGLAYLPPLLAEMGLGNKLQEVMVHWEELSSDLPGTLGANLAPYGAMVCYRKKGDLNAFAHEMAKRCCWCAQEEIYHLAIQMREQVLKKSPDLEWLFSPPCISKGACGEGGRYCGRDLSNLGFQKRNV